MPTAATVTADALAEANRTGDWLRTRTCHTGALLTDLPADAQAAVILALTTPGVRTADITKALIARGLPAKTENVGRHRRRLQGKAYGCKCPLLSEVPT